VRRNELMAIKHDPYVIVFKCIFSCTYAISCLTQWRIIRTEEPRANHAFKLLHAQNSIVIECFLFDDSELSFGEVDANIVLSFLFMKFIYERKIEWCLCRFVSLNWKQSFLFDVSIYLKHPDFKKSSSIQKKLHIKIAKLYFFQIYVVTY